MKRSLTSIIIFLVSVGMYGQITEKLRSLGFENIQITETNEITTVAFEDNVYRGTYRGIGKAIETLLESQRRGSLEMIILNNRVPQLCITITEELITGYQNKTLSMRDVFLQMKITTSTDEACKRIKGAEMHNKSTWKTDIILYPEVRLENFSFDKLYHYAVNLSPAIQTSLWKGALFTAQVVFPIATNMNGEANKIHPGIIALSQEMQLNNNFLGRVVLGNFTDKRYGIQAELTYRSPNGRIEAGGVIGSTGFSEVNSEDGWYIGKKQRINGMLKGTYYEPHFNLELNLQAGRFVYGDYGVRGDCTRHFGEYAIGLYGMLVEGEINGGFHFTIPIQGKKWNRNKMVRVKLPEYYAAEYSMEPYGKYIDEKMGYTYNTRADENRSSRFYQPDYIRYFLIKELTIENKRSKN